MSHRSWQPVLERYPFDIARIARIVILARVPGIYSEGVLDDSVNKERYP